MGAAGGSVDQITSSVTINRLISDSRFTVHGAAAPTHGDAATSEPSRSRRVGQLVQRKFQRDRRTLGCGTCGRRASEIASGSVWVRWVLRKLRRPERRERTVRGSCSFTRWSAQVTYRRTSRASQNGSNTKQAENGDRFARWPRRGPRYASICNLDRQECGQPGETSGARSTGTCAICAASAASCSHTTFYLKTTDFRKETRKRPLQLALHADALHRRRPCPGCTQDVPRRPGGGRRGAVRPAAHTAPRRSKRGGERANARRGTFLPGAALRTVDRDRPHQCWSRSGARTRVSRRPRRQTACIPSKLR